MLLSACLLWGSAAMGQSLQRENGWYNILDGKKDSIAKVPIVTVKDFVALRLDSTVFQGRMQFQIAGTIGEHKRGKWADATEKAVGKRIGFVFNNKVITAPQVNMRIESGRFAISAPQGDNLKEIYREVLQEMAGEVDAAKSCTDESGRLNSKKLWEEANKYRASVTDTTFLQTRGRMSDQAIDALTPNGWNNDYAFNQVVYLKALERARKHLSLKDNQLVCHLKSGKEIRIAEDLYEYILALFKDWNKWVKEGRCRIVKDGDGGYEVVPVRQGR